MHTFNSWDAVFHLYKIWNHFTPAPTQPSTHFIGVLEDKISSKVNLANRRYLWRIVFVACEEETKTTSHLFYICMVAWLVWSKCYEWVGLTLTVHHQPNKHFAQFRLIKESEAVNQIWSWSISEIPTLIIFFCRYLIPLHIPISHPNPHK